MNQQLFVRYESMQLQKIYNKKHFSIIMILITNVTKLGIT